MKKLLTILVAAALCMTAACEKKTGAIVEPTRFDPEVDGPPSILDKPTNAEIAEDQRKIAQQAPAPASPVTPAVAPAPAAPTVPPAVGPVAEVRQVVAQMITTLKPGQEEEALAFVDPQDVPILRPMMDNAKRIATKLQALEALVQTKLAVPLPKEMKEGMSELLNVLPNMPKDFSQIKYDDIQFQLQGQEVAVTGPQGLNLRFAKVAAEWKIKQPPQARSMMQALLPVHQEMLGAFTKAVNVRAIRPCRL